MFVAFILLVLDCVLPGSSLPLENNAITAEEYNDLRWYVQYAMSAYAENCRQPNGNTLVSPISNPVTHTQGFIARDDNRKEIVVALRGSESGHDFVINAIFPPTLFHSPGVNTTAYPRDTYVHTGFLAAYNSVARSITSHVTEQLRSHPNYGLVTTGHSLGGALASLAAASLKVQVPSTKVRMYTYGQPRTGNPAYAFWINDLLPSNTFRSVHTEDVVPSVPPRAFYYNSTAFPVLGYRHHGVEYWQTPDPASSATTRKCAVNGEDDTCSYSVSSLNTFFIDRIQAHKVYYGINTTQTFCV